MGRILAAEELLDEARDAWFADLASLKTTQIVLATFAVLRNHRRGF